jgi:hypothetical protein
VVYISYHIITINYKNFKIINLTLLKKLKLELRGLHQLSHHHYKL